jgi:hypothetical protein
MGNSKSLLGECFIQDAPHINTNKETTIVRNLKHSSVISYTLTIEVKDDQILEFGRIVDAVGRFKCLTLGQKIDIFIDDEIHYGNVENFNLFLLAMHKSIVRIKTYSDQPVVLSCVGYSFSHGTRMQLSLNTIKTRTTKYIRGKAFKVSHQ